MNIPNQNQNPAAQMPTANDLFAQLTSISSLMRGTIESSQVENAGLNQYVAELEKIAPRDLLIPLKAKIHNIPEVQAAAMIDTAANQGKAPKDPNQKPAGPATSPIVDDKKDNSPAGETEEIQDLGTEEMNAAEGILDFSPVDSGSATDENPNAENVR